VDGVDSLRSSRRWRFVAGLIGVVLLVVSGIAAYVATRDGDPAAPSRATVASQAAPRPVPELRFQDGEGRPRALSDFRGRTVLLNIWATWCVPCREEMPTLDRLQQKLGGPAFEVVALSIDSKGIPAVRRFFEEIGVRSLAVYVDPSMQATEKLRIVGVPTTLLIDREGRELWRKSGPAQWDGEEVVRVIAGYLNTAKP
jgi:thiol-disulfide isomerase/thioredoxin